MILPDASEGEKRPFHFGNTTFYTSRAPRNSNALNSNTNTNSRNSPRDYNSQNDRQSRRQDNSPYSSNSDDSSSMSTESSASRTSSDDPYEEQTRRTPPPAYTPYDPRSSVPAGYDSRYNQPRSNNRRSPYHSGHSSGQGGPSHGRRHRATPDNHAHSARSTSPPQPHPFPSAYQSSVGAPPPGLKPVGQVATYETNGSIKGAYIIDPDKTNESTGRVQLTTSNGAIDIDLAVLPASLSARTGQLSRKTADLIIDTSCGGIKLRVHDAPFDMLARANRADIQRITTVYAKSSNGNVNIFLPRSFRGILKTTTSNGKMKFSEGILEHMTSINTWGAGKIAFIGSTEGLPPIPPEIPAGEEEEDDYGEEGVNISYRGNGFRNPGSGFFNGARNFSIVGGTFNTFPADAQVFHSWSSPGGPTTTTLSSRRGSNSRRNQRQTGTTTDFEGQWDGSRVEASSSNGNVLIAYDDEDAFGLSGKWKSEHASSDSRRGVRSNFVITGGDWSSWTGIMGAVF